MISKRTLLIFGCISSLMLIFNVGSAHAVSTSLSGAFIDWDTFSYSFTDASGADITEAVSWQWQGSYSEASALNNWDDDYDQQDEEGWVDTSAWASVENAEGYGWTGWSDILELVDTDVTDAVGEIAWAEANGLTGYGYSYATAERGAEFEVFATGDLTLSVDYLIAQDLSTEYDDEYAFGWSFAGLDLYNFESEDFDVDDDELENEVWDGDTYSDYADGTLMVTLGFEEGDYGDFYAWVENEAEVYSEHNQPVVPEPASLSLLSLGFLGFGFLKRRRRGTN